MSSNSQHKLLLNYHNACLYQSDLRILMSPNSWLNDSCIHFRLTQLDKQCNDHANLFFMMDPSVLSYIMHQCDDDDLKETHISLSLQEKRFLFIPINDGMDTSTDTWKRPGGGSHYSMLFVIANLSNVPQSEIFFHFDSCGVRNKNIATLVSQRIWKLLHINDLERTEYLSSDEILFHECRTPQQNNNYDCALYALKIVEILMVLPHSLSTQFNMLTQTSKNISPSCLDEFKRVCEEIVETSLTSEPYFSQKLRQNMAMDVQSLSNKKL